MKKAGKLLKRILIGGIFPLLAFGSCISEKEIYPPSGDAVVTFSIMLPGQGAPASRAMTDGQESDVAYMDILVFEPGGDYVYTARCSGTDITTDGGNIRKKSFTAKLRQGEFDLVLLANARTLTNVSFNGKNKQQALELLVAEMPASGKWPSDGSRPIPMWGDVGALTINESTALTGSNAVTMTRMIARVDVGVTATKFLLKSVHVYNYNTKGHVVPAASAWNAAGKVATAPTVVAGTRVKGPVDYAAAGGESIQDIYLFEAGNLTGGTPKQPSDRTCLVVGGVYDTNGNGVFTDDGDPTYYRVDFSTGSGVSEAFKDVLRNHHYTVDITNVTQRGYGTAEDAFVGGSQLTATVTEWNLATQGVIGDGQWWLMVNRDEIVYDYLGGETDITAQTNYNPVPTQGFPAGIRMDDAEIEYTPAVTPGEEWITLTGGSDGDMLRTIKITAAQNASATGRAAKVKIRAGNFTKVINVEQSGASFTFNVTGVAAAYTYAGGVQTFTVESHATATLLDETSSTFAVPWTAQFSEDGETWTDEAPEWLIIPTSGAGSTVATQYNAELLAMEESENVNEQDNTLRTNPTRGAADAPYDLSTKGTGVLTDMNTANCYIVNGGGYYKLPLVYGNAVKGGATNSSAYISSQNASSTLLKNFLRHDGLAITGPYIYDQFTPADAVLVWMDYPGLIVNVRLTDENKYLAFDIPQSTMGQGNAIVAVRNASGTIMWSWHIWVTPLVDMDNPATDATTNRTLVTRYFMQYNLGWCTGRAAITYGTGTRSVQVRIKQAGTNSPQSFTLMQNNGNSTVTEVNNPFWQWGRKDPLTPGTGIEKSNVDKITYGNYKYTAAVSTGTIGGSIQNPHMFYPSSGNWTSSGNYYNLWSADNTVTAVNDNPVVKTVYDPSPTGFVMPAPAAWTGFTTTGDSSGNPPSVIRAAHPFNLGWNFYTNYPENSGSAFYPASGCRINTGAGNLSLSGKNGYVWAATPYNVTKGNYMSMYDGVVDPQNNTARAYAIPVRPCKEQ